MARDADRGGQTRHHRADAVGLHRPGQDECLARGAQARIARPPGAREQRSGSAQLPPQPDRRGLGRLWRNRPGRHQARGARLREPERQGTGDAAQAAGQAVAAGAQRPDGGRPDRVSVGSWLTPIPRADFSLKPRADGWRGPRSPAHARADVPVRSTGPASPPWFERRLCGKREWGLRPRTPPAVESSARAHHRKSGSP